MSNFYPRRVKDLPKLEPESEDELKTPLKTEQNKNKPKINCEDINNKENVYNEGATAQRPNSISKPNLAFMNMRLRTPKRTSELPALESDSSEDDDDILKNDHFNCAILNDSFLMSASRSDLDDSTSSLVSLQDASVEKLHNKTPATDNTSLIACFNDMALASSTATKTKPLTIPNAKITTSTALTVIQENEIAENSEEPIVKGSRSFQRLHQTPYKCKETMVSATTTNTNNNTSNTTETQFATPHICSFSVVRPQRSRNLISTQTKKVHTTPSNNRSQKVLFQTPMAIARPPVGNDSITLSLCDTINKTPETANITIPKANDIKIQINDTTKTKKSLESAFNVAEHKSLIEAVNNVEQQQNVDAATSISIATASTNASTDADASKSSNDEVIINIKNINYKIFKKLGAGGSSTVYAAQCKDNGMECALKVVNLQGDPAAIEGYLNETKLLAKLQGNVCVVALYDYQLLQKESRLYLVMEKGDSDLNKILQTYTTNLPLYVLVNILYQMLQAVNYIHQNGVIHSDLKPANFLMVNSRLKLIDFGIASNIANDSTSIIKITQAGTFNYISPEALTDTSTGNSPLRNNQPKIKISTKSDVWSLGCILYLLLYKKTPFSHIKNTYAKINAISNPNSTVEYPVIPIFYPAMLLHMVKNCLQHNPKKRPSCAELLQYPFHMIIQIKGLAVPETSKST